MRKLVKTQILKKNQREIFKIRSFVNQVQKPQQRDQLEERVSDLEILGARKMKTKHKISETSSNDQISV